MYKSIRFQLTVWYVGVLGAILALFSVGLYTLVANSINERVDGTLRSATQVAALALNHEIEEHGGRELGEESVRLVLNTMHQTSFPRPAIVVRDGQRVVAEKPGSAGMPAGILLKLLPPGRTGLLTIAADSGEVFRIAVASVAVPFIGARYEVVANESLSSMEAELSSLRENLLILVPICLLIAAAGGYMLARKSLAPVLAMAKTAEQISSHNLDKRLTVANPNDELGLLAETFNRLFSRLQQTFRQQRQFMADASHELRTPISVALTATQVNLNPRTQNIGDLYEALEVVQAQLRRLRRVVEDMFTLARADASAYSPAHESFYLDEVVIESAKAARVLGQSRCVQVDASLLATDTPYVGDEGLIRQMVLILLDNAVKYSQDFGKVSVSLAAISSGYEISVTDKGGGIPEKDQPYIFDRFYRADKARSRSQAGLGGGAGLGLSIARWVADLHNGTVELVRSGTDGSAFRVFLPFENVQPNNESASERVSAVHT